MENAFKLSIDSNGIASLVFDLPNEKVNTFSGPVIEELEKIIDGLATNKEIKILAISSAKKGVFIAGADLHSFEPMASDPSHVSFMIEGGHRVFNKISNLPFPTVALINGACLGGGMELALACTYRVVSDSPKTLLGLPEVTLGIIPGWGGTQRLPRLVGLIEALPLILSGKSLKGNQAWKIKLADALFASEFFDAKAFEFIKKCLSKDGQNQIIRRRQQRGLRYQLLENNPIGRGFLFNKAKKDILKKTKGLYPAPLIALALIKETCRQSLETGLKREIEVFKENALTGFANSANLIHLFFIQEALKKDPGIDTDAELMKISSTGVIGAGIMGSGIAWLLSSRDIPVRMKDVDWNAVGRGMSAIHSIYAKMVKDKKLKPCEESLKFHRLSGSVDYSGFKNLDLVIEAAVENLELKQKVIAELEDVLSPNAIIASNTSSITIDSMSSKMKHPERFIGMHFFNPVNRMPLVEIIPSSKTSAQTIKTAVDICRKLGKTPIVVGDCAGFLVNRIFLPGVNEIVRIFEEGTSEETLSDVMLAFGMPMPPFTLADEVGNDVTYKVSKVLENAYGSRMAIPKLVTAMYENQLYGKKCGIGFYIYKNNKKKFNPKVKQLRKNLNIPQKKISDTDIRDRVFLLMINEAARCMEEKIATNPAYLDLALIMGIGFPPFRGGLLRYADKLGINYIVNQLKRYKELYGERFVPCKKLLEMQRSGESFF